MTYVGAKELILGERREITLNVWLSTGVAFTVADPSYTLSYSRTGEEEAGGSCELESTSDGYALKATVQPKQQGGYLLQFTFSIGEEIVKKNVQIKVN